MATIVTVPNEAMPAARTKINSNFTAINGELVATTAAVATKLASSLKGAANGVAELDADGKVPSSQLPASGGAVSSVAGRTGDVTLAKADVGLGSAENTADADKPISTAMQTALDGKASTASVAAKADWSDARFPTADEKAALAGTAGIPSVTNKFVTDSDARIGANRTFDVVAAYNGSGCRTRTTGTVSAASTALVVASASTFHVGQGILIKGAGALIRTHTDIVTTSGSPDITSAAGFAGSDHGKAIVGAGIPAGATLAAVNGTTAKLSVNATASATGVSASLYNPHVTTISAIVGTAITLANATTTAASSAVVQHDDTAAIDAALLAAFNAGGGLVYLTKVGTEDGSGIYRCNRNFDATSRGIITVPFLAGYDTDFIRIEIIGEVRGSSDILSDYSGDENNVRGVAILANDAAAYTGVGSYPAVIACSRYSDPGTGLTSWSRVDVHVDRLAIVVAPNPAFGGIRMSGNQISSVGDSVMVVALGSGGLPIRPTDNEAVGIYMPIPYNSVSPNFVGQANVWGFYYGVIIGELTELRKPFIYFCDTGLLIRGEGHKCTSRAAIMYCRTLVECVDGTSVGPIIDLDLTFEKDGFGHGFYAGGVVGWSVTQPGRGFVGTTKTYGRVTYEALQTPKRNFIEVTNAPHVEFINLARDCGQVNTQNPLAIFRFDDANDRSGNALHLTAFGTPTYGAGKVGNGVTLNGTTQYFTSALVADRFARAGSYSITGWFKATGVATQQVICGIWKSLGALAWRLSIETSGKLRLYVTSDGGAGTLANVDTAAAVSAGVWNFFAIRINSTGNLCELRVNDEQWVSVALPAGLFAGASGASEPFLVGTDGYGGFGTLLFAGEIDAMHIWERVVSNLEVAQLYNGGNGIEI